MADTGSPADIIDGPAAPPRANGELVFTESWQPRMFAGTVTLHDRGLLDWEEFRQALIREIAAHEAELGRAPGESGSVSDEFDYWGCWQAALETVVTETELVDPAELTDARRELENRPPDH